MTLYVDSTNIVQGDATPLNKHNYFLEKSKEIYKDMFGYEKALFNHNATPVTLICREHGEFTVPQRKHFRALFGGCESCREDALKAESKASFIQKAQQTHGERFEYHLVVDASREVKLPVLCKVHGQFEVSKKTHLNSSHGGCPECKELGLQAKAATMKPVAVIKQIDALNQKHQQQFSYEKTDFSKPENATVTCKDHGDFQVELRLHKRSMYGGCEQCFTKGEQAKKVARFTQKATAIHGELFDYKEVTQVGIHLKVQILCKKHGAFLVTQDMHLQHRYGGCFECRKEAELKNKNEKIMAELKAKHPQGFSYEKSVFHDPRLLITVTCIKHGDFQISLNSHMKQPYGGCQACADSNTDNSRFLAFIAESQKIHNYQFNFHKTKYHFDHPMIVTCVTHGDFQVTRSTHLRTSHGGCQQCATDKKNKVFVDSIIQEGEARHGNKFSYEKVKYTGHKCEITVTCKAHGDFQTTKYKHLVGVYGGCHSCIKGITADDREVAFKEKAAKFHDNKYLYDAVVFGVETNPFIQVFCKKHGEFTTTPYNHMKTKSGGCNYCRKEILNNAKGNRVIAALIQRYGEAFTYEKADFINGHTPFIVTCAKHGDFSIKPNYHRTRVFGGCEGCKQEHTKDENKKEFLEKIESIFGSQYSYPNLSYLLLDDVIEPVCAEHGAFRVSVRNHLKGVGCSDCIKSLDKPNSQLNEFVKRAKSKHGDLYDYSNITTYNGSKEKITIRCTKHDVVFHQTPILHLRAKGCPECKFESRSDPQEAIKRLQEILGEDRYDFSQSVYRGSKEQIKVICKQHGIFTQVYSCLVNGGRACLRCSNEELKKERSAERIREFRAVHGDKYDYTKTVVIKNKVAVEIICPKHGSFEITPANHLLGGGCHACHVDGRYTMTREQWIAKFNEKHKGAYSYARLPENVARNKSIYVTCLHHGVFKTRPATHLESGCPKCERIKKGFTKVIPQLQEKYKGKLSFHKVIYTGKIRDEVVVTCLTHGDFKTRLRNLLRNNYGCPSCHAKMDTEQLVANLRERFGEKFVYSTVVFNSYNYPIRIKCRKHNNEISTTARKLLREKFDCSECISDKRKK